MDCHSCKRIKEKKELIFESNKFVVFLAHDQTYLARCFVDLKTHKASLSDLTKEEWIDFGGLVKKLENALIKSFNATMFNWSSSMNNAFLESFPDPHVHFHFRPRYSKEVDFQGKIFKDPNFGKHYDRTMHTEIQPNVRKKIIEKIRENL